MKDEEKTREQLVDELTELRQQIAELQAAETERKRAQREIEERRMYLEALLGAAPDAVITLDAHCRIVEWNPGAEKLFGYSRQEVVGQDLDPLLTNPDTFEEAVGFTQIVMSGKDVPPVETVRCRKDGSLVDVIVAGSPILVGDEFIGVVAVYTDITERKRAEAALEQRAAQLALLNDIGEKVAAVLELDSVLDRAARLVQEGFGYHHVALFTVDRERGELVMRARAGAFTDLLPPNHRIQLGQGLVGWVGLHGEKLLANHVEAEPRYVNFYPDVIPTQSELSVPIRVGREIVGVLDVQSPQLDAFDENDVMLIETLADQMAVAIENARLYEAIQQELIEREQVEEEIRARELFLTLLNDITRAALETPDLQTMLQTLADRLGGLLGADGCYLTLWDEAAQVTIPTAASGPLRQTYPRPRSDSGELTMTGSVLRAGHPLVAEDVFNSPYLSPRIAAKYPARSLLGLPLIAGDQKLGAALIAFNKLHHFTPDEIARGEQAAGQIALAVAKARLLEETHARWREAETLRRAGTVVTETLSLDVTLARILEQLDRVVPYDSASVQLLRTGYTEIVSGRGFPKPQVVIGLRFPVPGDNVNTMIVEGRKPLVLSDVRVSHPSFFGPPHEHIRSWLGVPLIVRDRVIGMLTLDSVEPGYFGKEHVRPVTPFATQAAIAIENARLYEAEQAERQVANTLQEVSQIIGSTLELNEVLRLILEQLERVLDFQAATVLMIDEAGHDLYVREWKGYPDGTKKLRLPLRGEKGITVQVARTGQPVYVPDTSQDERYVSGGFDGKSELAAPLKIKGKVIGVLNAESEQPNAYDEDDLYLLVAFANQVAVAIENARLVEGLEAEVAARTAEIVAEREKSEAILHSAGDAIGMIDLQMRIQYVNEAFTTLTGYTAEETIGRPANFLVAEKMPEHDWQSLQVALTEGEVWQGEATLQRKDGRTYEAVVIITPVRDAEGHLVGYVATQRDISQLKELERARRQFMASVSHELRTPVANMKLYAQLLQMGRRPERTEHYLQVLVEQADRLAALTKDMLDMTELDSGRTVMVWGSVPLPTIIRDVVARYQSRAEASGLALVDMPIPPDLPTVKGDQLRLAQALGELVENAVIFTPAGGQVTVEARSVKKEGRRWVTIAVRDTGPGISLEEQEHIFDRFYRGRLAESGHVPGSGLGLSIAEEIVRAHGGCIEVESHMGEDSTFTIWLPVRAVDGQDKVK